MVKEFNQFKLVTLKLCHLDTILHFFTMKSRIHVTLAYLSRIYNFVKSNLISIKIEKIMYPFDINSEKYTTMPQK